ncbi:cyclin-L1-like isoform X1 [Anopheles darlingi]|uniref:cyclin-L1-like isoform X1 n=1 Tax=Anopheles darlingi TaxID=43151 RepID=UPI0021000BAF|nr:cyclin-L1-like isoform X1 [Anopheles darlingi]
MSVSKTVTETVANNSKAAGEPTPPPATASANLPLQRPYGKIVLTLENCLLPEAKLDQTPSQSDGLDRETETDLRILGCELIQTAGILLKLPQVAMATGQVLFQRFFYSKSFVRHSMEATAMSCICLASKIEEAPRRIRDVINVFHHIKQVRSQRPMIPMILDQHYINLKSQVIKAERRVLKELGFCVHVKHPHKLIVMYLKYLELEMHQSMMQMAWNFMNDSFRTDVFVRHQPETIACACIYLTARKQNIPLPNNPPWFVIFRVSEDDMLDVSYRIMALYRRAKPNAEQLDLAVEALKKQYQEQRKKDRPDTSTPPTVITVDRNNGSHNAWGGFIQRALPPAPNANSSNTSNATTTTTTTATTSAVTLGGGTVPTAGNNGSTAGTGSIANVHQNTTNSGTNSNNNNNESSSDGAKLLDGDGKRSSRSRSKSETSRSRSKSRSLSRSRSPSRSHSRSRSRTSRSRSKTKTSRSRSRSLVSRSRSRSRSRSAAHSPHYSTAEGKTGSGGKRSGKKSRHRSKTPSKLTSSTASKKKLSRHYSSRTPSPDSPQKYKKSDKKYDRRSGRDERGSDNRYTNGTDRDRERDRVKTSNIGTLGAMLEHRERHRDRERERDRERDRVRSDKGGYDRDDYRGRSEKEYRGNGKHDKYSSSRHNSPSHGRHRSSKHERDRSRERDRDRDRRR